MTDEPEEPEERQVDPRTSRPANRPNERAVPPEKETR